MGKNYIFRFLFVHRNLNSQNKDSQNRTRYSMVIPMPNIWLTRIYSQNRLFTGSRVTKSRSDYNLVI